MINWGPYWGISEIIKEFWAIFLWNSNRKLSKNDWLKMDLWVTTYLIASAFFSVYEMAIDTLFLCFLQVVIVAIIIVIITIVITTIIIIIIFIILFISFQDLEMNDGSEEKPYYMSADMMRILSVKNKTKEEWKFSWKDRNFLEIFNFVVFLCSISTFMLFSFFFSFLASTNEKE